MDRWRPCLEVTAATPLVGTAAALHDAYLLRLTSETAEGIAAYDTRADLHLSRDAQLMYTLYWMDVLDQLWAARLTPAALSLQKACAAAQAKFPTPERPDRISASLATASSIRSPMPSEVAEPDIGIPAYSQTDRVRLRDELLHAREQLFGWMRDQVGMPRPPNVDAEDRGTLPAHEADGLSQEVNEAAAVELSEPARSGAVEAAEEDQNDVSPSEPPTEGLADTDEAPEPPADQQHYTELFDRKVCLFLRGTDRYSWTPMRTRTRKSSRLRSAREQTTSRRLHARLRQNQSSHSGIRTLRRCLHVQCAACVVSSNVQ